MKDTTSKSRPYPNEVPPTRKLKMSPNQGKQQQKPKKEAAKVQPKAEKAKAKPQKKQKVEAPEEEDVAIDVEQFQEIGLQENAMGGDEALENFIQSQIRTSKKQIVLPNYYFC